jgi:hypothetical protein
MPCECLCAHDSWFVLNLIFILLHLLVGCNGCRKKNLWWIILESHFNRSLVTCIICKVIRGGPMNIVFELFGWVMFVGVGFYLVLVSNLVGWLVTELVGELSSPDLNACNLIMLNRCSTSPVAQWIEPFTPWPFLTVKSNLSKLQVLWNLLHLLNTLRFNAHFGNINNILKTIRRCQMLTGCYFMKRVNSYPILSLSSL